MLWWDKNIPNATVISLCSTANEKHSAEINGSYTSKQNTLVFKAEDSDTYLKHFYPLICLGVLFLSPNLTKCLIITFTASHGIKHSDETLN